MVRLVYIPSFGTDSTLYSAIRSTELAKFESLFTEWLAVEKSESLADYAAKFIETYHINSQDVLVGVSLGGILAIEINKILSVRKVISISSIKSTKEHPRLFKILRITKGYHLFSPKILKFGLDLIVPLYGRNVSSYMWFRKVFKNSDNDFLKWAFREIIHWQNVDGSTNLIHIHGSRDPLFPIGNAKKINYKIKGGTHAMIRFRAEEIAAVIESELFYL